MVLDTSNENPQVKIVSSLSPPPIPSHQILASFSIQTRRRCPNTTGGPKVYDVSDYLDDHPGGAEVMLDVSGQDADEFFEDIGHSRDAREELAKHLVGTLKMSEEELKKRAAAAEKAAAGGGPNILVILIVIIAIALGYYKTQMA